MTAAQAFWRSAGVFAAAGCCVATPALATVASTTDVEVSRVTLALPGADWKVSEPLPYGVAVRDTVLTVGGQSRLFVAGPSGTRDEIVMLVSATRGQRNVTLHDDCDPAQGVYVRKFNRGQSTTIPLQCLNVQGPVRLPADLKVVHEGLAAALGAQQVVPPPTGYVMSLTVCNDNGAIVEIVALMGSHFAGLDAAPAGANVPARMPGGVAAWADKLSEAALGTLSSWSGRMDVPPVVFRTPPSPPVASSSAPASSVTIKD